MYYPLLRGKQFELIALREIATNSPELCQQFTPIIEPVTDNPKPLCRAIETLNKSDSVPLIVLNPTVGKFESKWLNNGALDGLQYHPVVSFNSDNEERALAEVKKIGLENCSVLIMDGCSTDTLKALKGIRALIINTDYIQAQRYKSYLETSLILLNDGFMRRDKNADYPKRSSFKSAIGDYRTQNLEGFSDFTITGQFFSDGGGPAYVVAIHLTELEKDTEGFGPAVQIMINHYTSIDDGTPDDPAGKFKQALSMLINDVQDRAECFYETTGIIELKKLYEKRHFPGLGSAKKISIKHHIESIATYLKENG